MGEDIKGVSLDGTTGEIYLNTNGDYSVTGLSGDRNQIFVCDAASLGENNTSCTFSLFFDGNANGYDSGTSIDGISVPANADLTIPPMTVVFVTGGDVNGDQALSAADIDLVFDNRTNVADEANTPRQLVREKVFPAGPLRISSSLALARASC